MKRLVVAIAAVIGLAMTSGFDDAFARPQGGARHSGGSHYGGHHGGHYGGHYGSHGGYYSGWYGGAYWPWYWGFGWAWPGYYGSYYPGYPYYAYPYAQPVEPPVYAEIAPPAAQALWYYCTDPAGYYPYIQNCNVPWMQVLPTK